MRPATLIPRMLGLALLLLAAPASAQWSRITTLPLSNVFSVWSNADTIIAGVDTATYVSTNAGVTFIRSAKPIAGVAAITAVRVRNGLLYAGTFGQGVFVSGNLGASWQAFNEGLVGGFLDSQLAIADFEIRSDSLYVATAGAGVYVRKLTGVNTWHHFGEVFEPAQASNMNDLALGGTRMLACAGDNGTMFRRDPADADWSEEFLDNAGLQPGFAPKSAIWNGAAWIVGTTFGEFRSVTGTNPWALTGPNVGALANAAFATRGRRIFAAFVAANSSFMETSGDDGVTFDLMENLPHVFVFQLATVGSDLYAGRTDGLWIRSVATVSVPDVALGGGLRLALAGANPFGNDAHLRFDLAAAGPVAIDVFDVAGRQVGERIRGTFPAGANLVSWSARDERPGIYTARLTVLGKRAVVRLVHVR